MIGRNLGLIAMQQHFDCIATEWLPSLGFDKLLTMFLKPSLMFWWIIAPPHRPHVSVPDLLTLPLPLECRLACHVLRLMLPELSCTATAHLQSRRARRRSEIISFTNRSFSSLKLDSHLTQSWWGAIWLGWHDVKSGSQSYSSTARDVCGGCDAHLTSPYNTRCVRILYLMNRHRWE